jgi:hypothetical protein
MSVGFEKLRFFGQFLYPALGDRSHHQSLKRVKLRILSFVLGGKSVMDNDPWHTQCIILIVITAYIQCTCCFDRSSSTPQLPKIPSHSSVRRPPNDSSLPPRPSSAIKRQKSFMDSGAKKVRAHLLWGMVQHLIHMAKSNNALHL